MPGRITRRCIGICWTGAVALLSTIALANLAVAQSNELSAQESIASLDRRIVELLKNLTKHDEAEGLARKALEIAESTAGRDSPIVAQRLDNLAFTIRVQHRYREAEPLLLRALSIRENLFGADSPDLCQSLTNIAVLQEIEGELIAAQRSLLRCLRLQERAFAPEHPTIGHTIFMLAKLYEQAGQPQEAEELRRRGEKILGPDHPAKHIAAYNTGLRQRDKTFFGQMSEYRWTGLRMHSDASPQRLILLGEATFNNGLWNLFEVEMVLEDGAWRIKGLLPLPIYWKVRS